jgi:hypothetical protein
LNGVRGDAFDPDTNGDGIPDGQQLDGDLDGIPDAKDPDAADNTAFFPLGPVPRYALFPITNALPPADTPQALQINDKGTVLYENGTWCGGKWTALAAPAAVGDPPQPQRPFAISLNDNDVILGNSFQQVGPLPIETASVRCFWSGPAAGLQLVKSTTSIGDGYAGSLTESFAFHGDLYRPQISNDNRITASFAHWEAGADGNIGKEIAEPAVWTLPASGQSLSTHAPIESSILFHGTGISWGYTAERNAEGGETGERKGQVLTPAPLPELPFIPYNVVSAMGGLMAFPGVGSDLTPQALIDGQWKDSNLYKGVFDMADDGTAIGTSGSGGAASIFLNGKWTGIERTAPGVPSAWKANSVALLDTTPGGWILAQKGGPAPEPYEYAVMLPIKVDGVDPGYTPPPTPPGTPAPEPPEYLAGGVDSTSTRALGGSGYTSEIWIMAPNGETNTTRFHSPLDATSQLKLTSNSNVSFTPELLSDKNVTVTVQGQAPSTTDTPVTLKLGGTVGSLSVPLKVKSMKKRTVKLAVHKVFGLDEHGAQTTPANFPTKAALEEHLNKVYGRQVNTFFDATMHDEKGPNQTGIDFDFAVDNNDQKLKVKPFSDPELTAATPNAKVDETPATANIDIWVIGGGVELMLNGTPVYGAHIGEAGVGKVIIDGDLMGYSGTAEEREKLIMHVFAHEIGHVMTTDDHPDKGEGNAVLKWKSIESLVADPRDKTRLMCSGDNTNFSNPGKQLIKQEWDLIEAWLKAEEARIGRSL